MSLGVAGALVAGGALGFGVGGAIAAGPPALPWLAARHDNHSGSLLMVAVLVALVVAILFGLVAAMAIRPG